MNKLIGVAVILVIIIMVLMSSCSIVKPGNRGIKVTLGSVSNNVLSEGIHMKFPFTQKIVQMSVKIQKAETAASAVSKDLQSINTNIAINYHILPDKVNYVYKEYAKTPKEAEEVIIGPKIQEIVKAIICKYNTLELISQRETIRIQIYDKLKGIISKYHIVLDELSIVNFEFSGEFQKAIERKQVAEQDAITAQKKLEQIKFEAEQKIAEARGEAESNRLKQQTLSPLVVEWEKIQKWNGVLPQVVGGGGTIIDLK